MHGHQDVTRLFLWRHPQVRGFEAGKFFGHTDVSLTRTGQKQARLMGEVMADHRLAAIYCSDLKRSRMTAEVIARRQGRRIKPKALRELRELNLGVWEGLSYNEIDKRYPHELQARYADLANYRVQGGESLTDLAMRVMPVIEDIRKHHPGAEVCLVGHGGLNRVVLAMIIGLPLDRVFRLEQTYGCLNIIEFHADGLPVLTLMNQPLAED